MIVQRFLHWADAVPERYAYVYLDRKLTYRQLKAQAQGLSQQLLRQGSGPVAILGGKEPEMVVGILACLMAGRTYIPIDRIQPPARLAQILAQTGAELILSQTPEASALCGIPCVRPEEVASLPAAACVRAVSDIAYVIFTSGSTGQPKGVPISRQNLNHFVRWISGLEPLCAYRGVRVLNQASFSFDLSVADLYYALCNGHTLVACNPSGDLNEIYRTIRENDINVMVATPSFLKLLLLDTEFCQSNYPGLRCVYLCGESLAPALADKLLSAFPDVTCLNAYGPTEATSAVCACRITAEMARQMEILPVAERGATACEIALEDGEIVLKGESVFHGYLGGDPGGYYTEGCLRCYRTGDLGCLREGRLYCLGRRDRQVKYKGYRIELDDVEANLARVDGVENCAVVAKTETDGTVRMLQAWVVLRHGVRPAEVKRRFRTIVPDYMCPRSFRQLDRLPVTVNGKIDRKALLRDD